MIFCYHTVPSQLIVFYSFSRFLVTHMSSQPAPSQQANRIQPPTSWWAVLALAAALAVLFLLAGFALINAPAAWRAMQAAAVSLSAQFYPASGDRASFTVRPSAPLVQSGEPFSLYWEYQPNTAGSFSVQFPCREGIAVYLPNTLGVYTPAPCGKAIALSSNRSSVRLIVVSEGSAPYRDIPFTISFTPNGSEEPVAQGSAIVTVASRTGAPIAAPSERPTPPSTTASPQQPAGRRVAPRPQRQEQRGVAQTQRFALPTSQSNTSLSRGKPNLVVYPLAVGYIDADTNAFVATTSPLSPSQRVAVRFQVKNEGGTTTPQWRFAAVLPTVPPAIFRSPLQQPLAPGDRIEFTLAFDKVRSGTSSVSVRINVDPDNKVRETNEGDNLATLSLPIQQ